jgi:hypothetical protein
LVVFSTVVPELFTGSTPWWRMIEPGTLVALLVSYGLPVLALRELSVRLRTGPLGLLISGLAYGLLNEGLIAKTIFRAHLPIDSYDGYGAALGVSWPWSAFIVCWHAVASVALPVAFTQAVFPTAAAHPWTPRWAPVALTAPVLIIGALAFGQPQGDHVGTPSELVALAVAMAVLVVASTRVHSTWRDGTPLASFLMGAAGLIAVAGLIVLATARPSPVWWFVGWTAVVAVGWLGTRRGISPPWLVSGFYAQTLAIPLATGAFIPH